METETWTPLWKDARKLVYLPPTGIAKGPLVPWILWALWVSRNKLIFNDKIVTIDETITSAIVMAKEWLDAQQDALPSTQKPHGTRNQTTNMPICQTDAAWCKDSEVAGLGCVVSPSHGNRALEHSKTTSHVCSPLVAEALALREWVLFTLDKGYQDMRFESDSSQLITAINSGDSLLNAYGIIEDILALAQNFGSVSFVCINRKFNVQADMLAKQAISLRHVDS